MVITAIRDKAGELLGFAEITRDSTERRLATERLKVSEAQLQTFMNHSPSLMFIKDLEGRYLLLSFTEQDILLLFYASLTDDDFEEVFGDFLVPAKPPQSS